MDMDKGGEWNAGEKGGTGQRGMNRRKKWNNCNSIINKIYLKTQKDFFWETL